VATTTAPLHEHRPLAAYGTFATVFTAALSGALVAMKATGRELPVRPEPADVLLSGIATHKLARLISRDRVSSFLRAPFTELEVDPIEGEPVAERPSGQGLQRAFGELVLCPYCLSQWIAAAFATGFVAAPRTTRFLAGIYTAETIADFLHVAHRAAQSRV
jgi:hypothetical protein